MQYSRSEQRVTKLIENTIDVLSLDQHVFALLAVAYAHRKHSQEAKVNICVFIDGL